MWSRAVASPTIRATGPARGSPRDRGPELRVRMQAWSAWNIHSCVFHTYWMDSIKVKTPRDFSSTSPKRKKHSTIACGSCRKLRIRCQGGQPPGTSNRTKPCNHCENLKKDCLWPEEDGRKRPRASASDSSDPARRNTPASDESASVDDNSTPQSALHEVHRLNIGSDKGQCQALALDSAL